MRYERRIEIKLSFDDLTLLLERDDFKILLADR